MEGRRYGEREEGNEWVLCGRVVRREKRRRRRRRRRENTKEWNIEE